MPKNKMSCTLKGGSPDTSLSTQPSGPRPSGAVQQAGGRQPVRPHDVSIKVYTRVHDRENAVVAQSEQVPWVQPVVVHFAPGTDARHNVLVYDRWLRFPFPGRRVLAHRPFP